MLIISKYHRETDQQKSEALLRFFVGGVLISLNSVKYTDLDTFSRKW